MFDVSGIVSGIVSGMSQVEAADVNSFTAVVDAGMWHPIFICVPDVSCM